MTKFVFFLLFPLFVFSQKDRVLKSLDTLQSNTEKLHFLNSTIVKQWYTDSPNIVSYARAFDSIAKIENIEEQTINVLNLYGMAYYSVKNYDKAIRYYLDAARILEKKGETQGLSKVYNNLASSYMVRKDFENTEKYFLKAFSLAKATKDTTIIAMSSNNLAIIYTENKFYTKANKMLKIAFDIFQKKNDSLSMSVTYMNIANNKIYTKNYLEAIDNYQKSIRYINNKFPLVNAVSNTGIGIALTHQKKYDKALSYLQKGLELSKKINHYEQLIEANNALADYYVKTNKYKEAYAISKEAQKLKDSLRVSEQDKNMADALTKYETEKKDAQLKVLSLETEKAEQQTKLFFYLAMAGLFIAGLIGFFFYKNRKKNALLAKQKKLLEATVDEKNVLLKETHHRVKNSFQIVSSLLYLQSESTQNKEAQVAMQEAQNRVRSMVLIHQRLYSKDQLVGIDTQEYFNDLTQDIFEGHLEQKNKINYSLDVVSIVLGIDTITPLGLILNELITNVIKHAFSPTASNKQMLISLKKEAATLVLTVTDNGKGMPAEIKTNSFGIQLITALAKKLKATLLFKKNTPTGTIATVTCKRFTEL